MKGTAREAQNLKAYKNLKFEHNWGKMMSSWSVLNTQR